MKTKPHEPNPRASTDLGFASRLLTTALALALFTLTLAVVQAPMAGAASNSFHTKCGLTNLLPDDPIVYPNQPGASHLHDFFGNTTTNARSTLSTLLQGGTACNVPGDTAAYWIPALITPGGQVVVPDRLTAYYYRGDSESSVAPFPTGLKMVAGGDTHNLKIAGYACGEGMPSSSVPLNCGGGQLKAVVVFPSCWDGRHTDSADHRSHMAYPSGRGCPSGFSIQVPKLIIHASYPVSNGQGYRLSSDAGFHTTNGMSMHADFFNAWNQATLTQLVQSCLNGVGSCPHM
ncbi:MAG: DUF1996 domain-containing protein [Actinomycetota bacterium]